jgi:O-antigen/teichoic acid export membrane protein
LGAVVTAIFAYPVVPFVFGEDFLPAVAFAIALAWAGILRPMRNTLMEVQKSYVVTKLFAVPALANFAVFLGLSILLFPFWSVFAIIIAKGLADLVAIFLIHRALVLYEPRLTIASWIIPRWSDLVSLIKLSIEAISKRGTV